MHEHGPDQFSGPVRGSTAWWQGMGGQTQLDADQAPAPENPRQKSKDTRPIRTELVKRVRKEIAAGTYDTPEKWEAALDCLLDRLDREF
jgi:hypothetical protein